ncbi:MAG: hypothetical protein M0Q91_10050 [Methanoregula sp.]|jgi:hypothetical protein|nr:hypothetical protein [Methanoregula sp.]
MKKLGIICGVTGLRSGCCIPGILLVWSDPDGKQRRLLFTGPFFSVALGVNASAYVFDWLFPGSILIIILSLCRKPHPGCDPDTQK